MEKGSKLDQNEPEWGQHEPEIYEDYEEELREVHFWVTSFDYLISSRFRFGYSFFVTHWLISEETVKRYCFALM
jgi:hypothetical protein